MSVWIREAASAVVHCMPNVPVRNSLVVEVQARAKAAWRAVWIKRKGAHAVDAHQAAHVQRVSDEACWLLRELRGSAALEERFFELGGAASHTRPPSSRDLDEGEDRRILISNPPPDLSVSDWINLCGRQGLNTQLWEKVLKRFPTGLGFPLMAVTCISPAARQVSFQEITQKDPAAIGIGLRAWKGRVYAVRKHGQEYAAQRRGRSATSQRNDRQTATPQHSFAHANRFALLADLPDEEHQQQVGDSRVAEASQSTRVPADGRLLVATLNTAVWETSRFDVDHALHTRFERVHLLAVQELRCKDGSKVLAPKDYAFMGSNKLAGFFVHRSILRFTQPLADPEPVEWRVWIRVAVPNERPLFACSIYGEQERCAHVIVQERVELIEREALAFQDEGEVVVLGDLNARLGRSHARVGRYGEDCNPSRNGKLFLHLLEEASLLSLNGRMPQPSPLAEEGDEGRAEVADRDESHAVEYTHREARANGSESVLDYILASERLVDASTHASVLADDLTSDHLLVWTHLCYPEPRRQKPAHKAPRVRWKRERLTRGGEKTAVRKAYAETVEQAVGSWLASQPEDPRDISADDIDRLFEEMVERVSTAAEQSVGKATISSRSRCWWNRDLTALYAAKQAAYQQARSSRSASDWEAFRKARKTLKKAVKAHKREYFTNFCSKLEVSRTRDPKFFWQVVRRVSNGKRQGQSISALKTLDGSVVTKPAEVCQAMQAAFDRLGNDCGSYGGYSVETREAVQRWHEDVSSGATPVISCEALDKDLCEEEVAKALSKITNHRAAGLNGVPGELLKYGGPAMVRALLYLFRVCFHHRRTPAQWKEGGVVPIFKKGDPTDPGNYRGITLLDITSKVYCNLLLARLQEKLDRTLSEEQSGFRPGRSCEDNLYVLSELTADFSRRKAPLYLVFVDIAKAYDRVWRDALWMKLQKRGVSSQMCGVLQEIYSNVSSKVLLQGECSSAYQLQIGVRQGCTLSPLLFDVYIDDLIADLREGEGGEIGARLGSEMFHAMLFADDLVLMAESAADAQELLSRFEKWCDRWRLDPNTSKTQVMVMNAPRAAEDGKEVAARLMLRGSELEQVKSFPFLGVVFQSDGEWNRSTDLVAAKAQSAYAAMSWLLRTPELTIRARLALWKAKVQPILEYGMIARDLSGRQKERLEKLQRRHLKGILRCMSRTANEALPGETGVLPLEVRRQVAAMRLADIATSAPKPGAPTRLVRRAYLAADPAGSGPRGRMLEELVSLTTNPVDRFNVKWREDVRSKPSLRRAYSTLKLDDESERPQLRSYLSYGSREAGTMFKVRTGTLAVMHKKHQMGRISSSACPNCDAPCEDIEHWLLVCPSLAETRSKVAATITKWDEAQEGAEKMHAITASETIETAKAVHSLWRHRCALLQKQTRALHGSDPSTDTACLTQRGNGNPTSPSPL